MQVPVVQWPNLQDSSAKMQIWLCAADRKPSADDLLVLLAVGRSGRYITAAEELGLNHTTISRRIAALERVDRRPGTGPGRPADGSSPTSAARRCRRPRPSRSAVRSLTVHAGGRPRAGGRRADIGDRRLLAPTSPRPRPPRCSATHPNVAVEIVAATRRATQQRSGLDVEVVVGEPKVHRAKAIRLGDYCLGLYGSRDYLADHGTPTSVADLAAPSAGLLHRLDAAGRRPRRGDELRPGHA